ncbi:MAG: gamma-glutamyltransferase [Gammaproteobacteria bacterium]|nr:gamma-glutamyltransferase [Gammaproteobacteria bacterium]
MSEFVPETWLVRKPAVVSDGGMVVTQHYLASEAGAKVLRDGGNAVDAAVTASFAMGAVEPWMSGLGGGGYMVFLSAKHDIAHAIEFGVKASVDIDPQDYPLTEGTGPDLFSWPSVLENRNISGPYSVAVPGMVAGLASALESFGTRSWRDVLQPAIRLADQGLAVDWYATLKISSGARDLARFSESKQIFLPHDSVPIAEWGGRIPRITLGKLQQTLQRLADAGPNDFYKGEIATDIVTDAASLGIRLAAGDLEDYRAHVTPVERLAYRDAEIDIVPGLTAGPTLRHALSLLGESFSPAGREPEGSAFKAYARCLFDAYEHRLAFVGDVPESYSPSCTTHLGVVDRDGNVVALTQTLLSLFGSKVTLPRTGILMNNGVMWFDPRPGHPNSIRPGKRPLSNMCPVILKRADGQHFAIGAAGGRRIMPAVFQLISFFADYEMSVDTAIHQGRIDVSGANLVTIDSSLPKKVAEMLSDGFKTERAQSGVYPSIFACPNVVGHDPATGRSVGGAFVMSPWAQAVPE